MSLNNKVQKTCYHGDASLISTTLQTKGKNGGGLGTRLLYAIKTRYEAMRFVITLTLGQLVSFRNLCILNHEILPSGMHACMLFRNPKAHSI